MDNEQKEDKKIGGQKPKDGALTIAQALDSIFQAFSHSSKGEDETLSLEDIDKWFEQADLLGEEKLLTKDDMASAFSKTAKSKKRVDIDEFHQMVEQLAADKELSIKELIERLESSVGESMFTHDRMHVTLGSSSDPSPQKRIHRKQLDEEDRGS